MADKALSKLAKKRDSKKEEPVKVGLKVPFDPMGDFKRYAHKVKEESKAKMSEMKNKMPAMMGPSGMIDKLKRKAGY